MIRVNTGKFRFMIFQQENKNGQFFRFERKFSELTLNMTESLEYE